MTLALSPSNEVEKYVIIQQHRVICVPSKSTNEK